MENQIVDTIALAIAFSPRLEANLAEAARLKKLFQCRLILIHVGSHDAEDEKKLAGLLQKTGLDDTKTEVRWRSGETVHEILEVCREEKVDLLVTGALEKESWLKYYMGSVARSLCRKAECSVLMLTDPSLNTHAFRHIVVSGNDNDKTSATIEMAMYLARLEQANTVDIVQESEFNRLASISCEDKSKEELISLKKDLINEEKEKLEDILSCTDCGNLQVNTRRLEGKPGISISNYAREQQADLLIMAAPENKLNLFDRVFQHDIEYVLANLPCNLLIVHSHKMN